MYSFLDLEPVCFSKSSSNCCFLTCIQISPEAGQVVWCSHLFKNFQFVVIHTVKGFSIVNKAELDVILEVSCFFDDPTDVGNLVSGSSAFSKSNLNIWKFMVHGSCKEKPRQMVGGAKLCLESNPIPAREAQRAQTYLVCTRTQKPHRD